MKSKIMEWMINKDLKAYVPKKASEKNNYSNEGKKLKFCNRCNMVWEIGITGTLLRYDHMPTYGLKRQDCFRCDKND